jgi:hypothetical protein
MYFISLEWSHFVKSKRDRMSEYQLKISSLQAKINKLKAQEAELIKKRKVFVGELAERLDLLIYSDACLAGMLNQSRETLLLTPSKMKDYEQKGKDFFARKSRCQTAPSRSEASSQSNTTQATPD